LWSWIDCRPSQCCCKSKLVFWCSIVYSRNRDSFHHRDHFCLGHVQFWKAGDLVSGKSLLALWIKKYWLVVSSSFNLGLQSSTMVGRQHKSLCHVFWRSLADDSHNKWGWCQRYFRWRTWLHLLQLCLFLISVNSKGAVAVHQQMELHCTAPFCAR
jgi:hypothetical protein